MTQNASDVEIDNQGFAAFRQDLNDVLEDITTLHSGTAAPSTTYANQWWYETDTDKLYIRNEDNDAWIEILTLDQANDHLASLGASITLDGTGNVSIDSGDFTVDTDTLHVDSTNDRVGVGTSSPRDLLSCSSSTGSSIVLENSTTSLAQNAELGAIEFYTNDGSNAGVGVAASIRSKVSGSTGGQAELIFSTADSTTNDVERVRIKNDGRVGIGTTSPTGAFFVAKQTDTSFSTTVGTSIGGSSSTGAVEIFGATTGASLIDFSPNDGVTDFGGRILYSHGSDYMAVSTNGTERMRIDSSGNVAIAKTAINNTDEGYHFGAGSYAAFVSDASRALLLNRLTSDGEIVTFRQANTTVGSIGSISSVVSYMVLDPRSGGVGIAGVGAPYGAIVPTDQNGATSDNSKDLGASTVRWDDVYATNGTIQTSDQNEKQQIASLTAAEITAAKAISKLFKTFKWNDSVAENGDNARTHAGVIAQDVQQAMTDAGLDAGDYAFFISTTWWETQTEVPAVEADEENGIEAADAYTRTDTYDTAEEAPEGATERTRLGIRYPELLAFIGAATEQRLADIETRLTALEAE